MYFMLTWKVSRVVFVDMDNRDNTMDIMRSFVFKLVREIEQNEFFFGWVESID